MLDEQLVKDLLESIGEGQYIGTSAVELMEQHKGDGSENDTEKFIYHMDELFDAGLYKVKSLKAEYRWGMTRGLGNAIDLTDVRLVLTPLGGEVLEELRKPKGLERLKNSIRTVGAMAGSEAVRHAVANLLTS